MATVSGAYSLKLALNSTWKDERAYRPLLSWLDEFSRFKYAENGYDALVNFALGASGVIVGIAKQFGTHCSGAMVKESLLRFNAIWMLEKPSRSDMEASLSNEIFVRVPESIRKCAISALDEIWKATSMDERIEALVNNAKKTQFAASDEDEQIFPGGVAGIRRLLQVPAMRRYHGIIFNPLELEAGGCPHCYQAFGNGYRMELRAKHFITCPNTSCKKPIFSFEDGNVAKRVMEAIINA